MLAVTDELKIDEDELTFTATRSGGPGGQNVNKTNTRVTLGFNVAASRSLTDRQRALLLRRLKSRLTKDGVLRLTCQQHRTQRANRKEATVRFVVLLGKALQPRRPRKKTRIPQAAKARRLTEKKRRGAVKQLRSQKVSADQ